MAEAQPNANGDPVVWVVQEQASTRAGGILSGLLDVMFYRPHLFAPLDGREVETRSQRRGFVLQVQPLHGSPSGEGRRDSLRLRVSGASLPVPELSGAPTDDAVRDFARTVNGDLLSAVKSPGTTTYDSEGASRKASVELVASRTVSSTSADDGSVRVTVETTSKVTPGAGVSAALANERLRRAVAQQVERVAQGVGRVVSSDVVAVEMPDPGKTIRSPWSVTARFDLAHRLA